MSTWMGLLLSAWDHLCFKVHVSSGVKWCSDGAQALRYTGILVALMGVLQDSAEGWMPASSTLDRHSRTIDGLECFFDPITPEMEAALIANNAAMVTF